MPYTKLIAISPAGIVRVNTSPDIMTATAATSAPVKVCSIVKFTTDALDDALKKLPQKHQLTIHSDQGFHYQHAQWVKRLINRNIEQSMSRRGNCIDNSPMENFFGLLKQEMYYGEKFTSIKQLGEKITEYINWYNNKRIKKKLNGLSPIEYRQQAA